MAFVSVCTCMFTNRIKHKPNPTASVLLSQTHQTIPSSSSRSTPISNSLHESNHSLPTTTRSDELMNEQNICSRTNERHNLHLLSYLTHLKFGCKNMASLIHMSKHQVLQDMPKTLVHPHRSCPICMKCKTPKLAR